MASPQSISYHLDYFTTVTFYDQQTFREADKNRFFQLYPQDSLTTVAISKLVLNGKHQDKTSFNSDHNLITRSDKKNGHAEKQTVEQIKKIIADLPGVTLESLTLVMNITYSPCVDCRPLFHEYLKTLATLKKVTFILRFAYLYHDRIKGEDQPISFLANWMIGLEREYGSYLTVRVEPVFVVQELSDYTPRDMTKWPGLKDKRQREDKNAAKIVEKVNKKKKEIEKENEERDKKLTALGKTKLNI